MSDFPHLGRLFAPEAANPCVHRARGWLPLSGSQSTYGKDQVKAAEWAVADINAKGGVNGKKRVALIYINNDTGIEAVKVYRIMFEKAGGQIVAYEAYDPKATDYTGALLKVRAANPDMIHRHGLVSDMPPVIAQMRQLGISQRVSTYSGGYNPQMIEKAGKGAEGLIVTSLAPNATQNPNVGPYLERWKKAENRIPNGLPYTQYLHDSAYLVAALYDYVDKNKLPPTGENMRKERSPASARRRPSPRPTASLPTANWSRGSAPRLRVRNISARAAARAKPSSGDSNSARRL